MNLPSKLMAAACMCLLATTGCQTRMADCTVASTKNVKLSKLDIDSLPRKKGVEGKSTQTWVLFFPVSSAPNIKDALDDALAKGDGDLMVDAVFYQSGWWFLVGQSTLSVKGEVVKTRTSN